MFAGEPSVRTSRLGMASPTFTKAGRVEWKPLEVAEARPDRAVRVRGRRLALNAIVTVVGTGLFVTVTKKINHNTRRVLLPKNTQVPGFN